MLYPELHRGSRPRSATAGSELPGYKPYAPMGMYSSTKFYAPQNTMIVLSTPIRQLDGIGHKMNRILDEDAYMKANWAKFNSLGTREKEVLTFLAQGLSNPQIAEALFISRSTVEQHRKNIYRKLELDNLVQLIKFALAFDLI